MSNEIILDSKRVEYAKSFRSWFNEDFTDMIDGEETEFSVSQADFLHWMVGNSFARFGDEGDEGEFIWTEVPSKNDPAWAKFLNVKNKVKAELNAASSYGAHGEPPYRVDYHRPGYVVRSLAGMVMVTAPQMASALQSLAQSRMSEFSKMQEYVIDNAHRLPPALHGSIRSHDSMFKILLNSTVRGMNDYIEWMREDYASATKLLENKGE